MKKTLDNSTGMFKLTSAKRFGERTRTSGVLLSRRKSPLSIGRTPDPEEDDDGLL